jgi:hypothetical protein
VRAVSAATIKVGLWFESEALRYATSPSVESEKVEKAATTFVDGIQNWWASKHESICDRAFDAGLKALQHREANICWRIPENTCVTLAKLKGSRASPGAPLEGDGGKRLADGIAAVSARPPKLAPARWQIEVSRSTAWDTESA